MTKPKQHICLTTLLMLVCASTWLSLAQADDDDGFDMSLSEVIDMIDPFAQSCEPKPERSHVEEMVLNKEGASQESKCLRRCMLKQFEVMDEGAKEFNVDKTIDMMNMMYADKEDTSRGIINKCNGAMAGVTDECDIAHGIAMCILHEMRAASYKIPDIKE